MEAKEEPLLSAATALTQAARQGSARLDHGSTIHHYVDISTPAKMLVLSGNEYLDKLPAEAAFPPTA